MATKEQDVKLRLASLLRDLQGDAKDDPESLFFIGSLAARLIDKAKARSWPDLKESLGTYDYDKALFDFQTQGKKLLDSGEGKKAYAIQALAISLVCRTQRKDFQMREGEALLDSFIGQAVSAYRASQRKN